MEIGIIGSGQIGGTLTRRLREIGHDVSVANSRGPASLADLAAETGAKAVTVEEAAKAPDIVIVTIPQAAVPQLPRDLFRDSSAVIIDTGNYYPSRDGQIAELEEGGVTESEWVSRHLGRPVVKAFNHIAAGSLGTLGKPAGTPGRISLSIAGDDPRSKEIVLKLIDELGFDGFDAGTLADSWRQQPGTPSYARDLDRPAREAALAEADAGRIAEYRKAADDAARAWFQKSE